MTENLQDTINTMDFETAFKSLQENVNQLENEELPLETALQLYERGQLLAKRCAALLEEAELRVRQLSPESNSIQDSEV